MTSIKKKQQKSFSSLSMGRRLLVLLSLVLVLSGCLALFSAIENQDWTQDEPTQRRIFLLSFFLLMASIILCYQALSDGSEMDEEKMAGKGLASGKHKQYNSFKPTAAAATETSSKLDSVAQDRLLALLESGALKNGSKPSKMRNHRSKTTRSPVISESNLEQSLRQIPPTIPPKPVSLLTVDPPEQQPKQRSLIVQLMPLLPLQLCEKELDKLALSQNPSIDLASLTASQPSYTSTVQTLYTLKPTSSAETDHSPSSSFASKLDVFKPLNSTIGNNFKSSLPSNQNLKELPATFNPINKNSEAG